MKNKSTVSGSFVLTPAAGKKLIGMGVARLPEVEYAFDSARLIVANGSTTSYVIEALTGEPVDKYDYCVGVIADGQFAGNPDSDHTMWMWEKGEKTKLPFSDFLETFKTFEKDDVFIKGANAVDPQGYAGGLQTNPFGGSWAQAIGIITARGFPCIVPVGLEKMIPSVIEASKKLGQMRLKYTLGNPPGMIPLTSFKVMTEIQAFQVLAGVNATPVAAGGIGGSEGSIAFVVEGTEDQVKKAFSFVKQVHDEPAIPKKKVSVESARLPQGF